MLWNFGFTLGGYMPNFSFFHRSLDAAETVGYGAATIIGGAVTLPLAVGGAIMFPTGVLTPVAAVAVLAAMGTSNLTAYAAAKTYHKAMHAMDKKHEFINPMPLRRAEEYDVPVFDQESMKLKLS